MTMRIRLRGTPDKIQAFADVFRKTFDVIDESEDYRDRAPSKLVRRYLEIELRAEAGPASSPVAQAEAERDAVYRERAHLVAALAVEYPSVLVDAPDVDEDGWKIVYIALGTGQCSWHIAPADVDLFEHVDTVSSQDERARWDQHTTEEKYQRIRQHVAQVADESYQAWADEGKAATYEHDPDEGKDLDYDEPPF